MEILHPDDLIEILGVCRTTAYQLCKRKDFPAHRAGKKIDIYPDELEAWRRKNTIQHRDRKPHAKTVPDAPKPVKIERKQYKTLIAVPCFDMVHTDFMSSLVQMNKPEGTTFAVIKNTLIYNARNSVVDNAVRMGFDRVLWLDSDLVFPPDLLERMSLDMDRTKADFISGLHFMRCLPTKPVIYNSVTWKVHDNGIVETGSQNYLDYPKNRIFEIAGCGFGCVLTSVALLKKMKERYGAPFTPMMGIGEDLAFCWRVNQTGGKMYCDPTIKLGHIGSIEINESHYRRKKSPK